MASLIIAITELCETENTHRQRIILQTITDSFLKAWDRENKEKMMATTKIGRFQNHRKELFSSKPIS